MATGQKILHSGYLGIVRQDRIDQRYFVLYDDILDFYLTADDVSNGEKKGRLAMADVEELAVLDDGFALTLGGGKTLTVRCDAENLSTWLDKITPFLDPDEEDEGSNVSNTTAENAKKDDRTLGNAAQEILKANTNAPQANTNAVTNKNAGQPDDESEMEVEVFIDGDLQIELQGKRESRYFWLTMEHLEYFKDQAAAAHEAPMDSFHITSIGQVDRTAAGFTVSRKDKKRQLVIVCDAATSREWISEIRGKIGVGPEQPAVGLGKNPGAKAEEAAVAIRKEPRGKLQGTEEEDAEVIIDEKLEIEINGKAMWKHTWLTTATFDYTETDKEHEDAIESFLITEISAVLRTANGFTVCHVDGRKIVIRCTPSTRQTWVTALQKLLDSKKPLAAVMDQTRSTTTPVWSKQAQGATPSPSSKNAPPPGYPGAKQADEPNKKMVAVPNEVQSISDQLSTTPRNITPRTMVAVPEVQSTPMLYTIEADPSVVCQGTLGILQRDQEERRYFVLYPDAFKYWLDQASYSRSDEPRGHVLNEEILEVVPTSTGFALSFDGGSQIVLICDAQRQRWLAEWRNILASRPSLVPASNQAMSGSIPQDENDFSRNGKPQANETASIITRSPINPAALVNNGKDVLFEGSLTLVRKAKQEQRYFVLLKDRLDYFASASEVRSGKTPRGRVWYRDIDSINLEGYRFTLALTGALSGSASSSMVLVAEAQDLQLWHAAWTETGVAWRGSPPLESKNTSRSVSPSPARANLQKTSPSALQEPLIHGAIIEGQFQLSRGKIAGTTPALRHLVLFPERLDYFTDAAAARRGRPLESLPTRDIQWIDVVDGGFEITVANRLYKLRELQGLLPQWIDALVRVFAER